MNIRQGRRSKGTVPLLPFKEAIMNIISGLKDFFLLNKNLYRLDKRQMEDMRQKQLFSVVNYALKHSKFYRNLYGTQEMKSLDDFYKFPVINKSIMMENFNELNTCGLDRDEVTAFAVKKELDKDYSGYYKDEFVIGLSSGTSGNKGIYVTSKSLTQRLPFVFLARSGIPIRFLPFRILFLLRVFSQGFEDINAPLIDLTYKSTMTSPGELIEIINSRKINIIMAPPSMLRILMELAEKIEVKLKLIVSYAEVLEKEDRERISRLFKTKVHEIYQASEGQIASTCKCGNLHINEDLVFIELYDKNGKEVKQSGIAAEKMILTNMVNFAQPLIRYEMNDVVVLGEKCPCGSSFRVIDKILGRNDDVLIFKNTKGEMINVFPDLFARWIITREDRIREYKVIQNSPEEIEIIIDIFKNSRDLSEEISENLKSVIHNELKSFDVFCLPEIISEDISLPENKAKYKRFVRRFDIENH